MGGALAVRRYRSSDADRIRELHRVAMRDAGALADGVPEPDLADVQSAYLDAGGEFLVGERDGDVIAMGGFRPLEGYLREFLDDAGERTAEFKRLRVDPAFHGQGYGRRLYAVLESRARAAGFAVGVLDTTASQGAAQALAETAGYEYVLEREVAPGEESFELLVYRKPLE